MGKMGIKAIYPKRNLSKSAQDNKTYPYLLGEIKVDYPNKVWSSDITYIHLRRGYIYLVAIMDLYSRYVLSWEVSNTIDVNFCLEALEKALQAGRRYSIQTRALNLPVMPLPVVFRTRLSKSVWMEREEQ